tara:strand:- start:389 stop:733 length:345 start_codon:yes stop_codon:yes gene_type:complete
MSDEKNMNCNMCGSDYMSGEGNACENCYPNLQQHLESKKLKKAIHEANECGWSLIKAQPCSVRGCGAMSTDSSDECVAGEEPSTCSRRRAETRHAGKQQRRQGGKVRHLEIGEE